ncbi:MAG: 2-oxoacid:acceptor oxidoreductase family protein [Thermoplasmata archaeon]|nr:2-oxoacid:acceptor oxidoreductase family protein [Thermoplasmata archaeon]
MGTDRTDVIWHGRGGQGAFTASKILGAAYTLGREQGSALAFPSFGPERRGAPVRAFTKLSPSSVRDRSEISDADFTVYLDRDLMSSVPARGTVLVNTRESFGDSRVVSVDASGLAAEVLGAPIANTAMVGALAAVWGGVSLESLYLGVENAMPERLWEKNKRVIERAYALAGGRI